jgi:DNA-binding protein H-NS
MNGRNDCGFRSQIVGVIVAFAKFSRGGCTHLVGLFQVVAVFCKLAHFILREYLQLPERAQMARSKNLENMSYAELEKMQANIERMKIEKQNAERVALRSKVTALAKEHGFDIHELFGKGRRSGGKVAVKYRDPSNPANTWTGRGRMPRWMAAATKGGKAKKEDFLIS